MQPNRTRLSRRALSMVSAAIPCVVAGVCPSSPSAAAQQMTLPYASRLGPDQFTGNMAVTASGDVFVAELVDGFGGASPTTDGTMLTGDHGLWVARLDPSSNGGPDPDNPSLAWGTILNGLIQSRATAVGAGGDLYVAGWTSAVVANPRADAFDPTLNPGRPGFVARFDAQNGALTAFTYFGTGTTMAIEGIAIGPSGEVAIAGWTSGSVPTTANALPYVDDPFVAVLNGDLSNVGGPAGDGLLYGSYLPGGQKSDLARGVAVDADGALWVCGSYDSRSTDVPTAPFAQGAQPARAGGEEGFLFRLDPADAVQSLEWATFFGGSGHDRLEQVTTDAAGNGWVCGTTGSADLLSSGFGGRTDAVVAGFSPGGVRFGGAYVGGSEEDTGIGIAFDAQGRAVIAGSTRSEDFPVTPNAFDGTHNSRRKDDVFVARLDAALQVTDASYLGGSANDTCTSLGVDANGDAYVGGFPASADFPTTVTTSDAGGFVARLSFEPAPPQPGITVAPTSGLVTDEGGRTDAFTVVLDTQPSAPVSVAVSTSDASEGTPTPALLQFDASNWHQPQTVTVTGVDDGEIDGDQAYTIVTDPATSADPDYDGVDAADVSVTNLDDDQAGVTVAAITPSSLTVGMTTAVEILGSGFLPGASVAFEGGRGRAPTAFNVVVTGSGTIMACVSAPSNAKAGEGWDVRVTNTDGSTGVLLNGFTVAN